MTILKSVASPTTATRRQEVAEIFQSPSPPVATAAFGGFFAGLFGGSAGSTASSKTPVTNVENDDDDIIKWVFSCMMRVEASNHTFVSPFAI